MPLDYDAVTKRSTKRTMRSQSARIERNEAVVEVPEVRLQFQALLKHAGFPRLLLRMEYGSEVPPTPRCHREEVLLSFFLSSSLLLHSVISM
jgi:hypothetical protein